MMMDPDLWGGLGNIASSLLDYFGSGHSPASAAFPYLQQVGGTISPYLNPYIHAGREALSNLMGQYSSLLQNPAEKLQQFGSHYHESPGFGFEKEQGLQAIRNAQAASGMAGSPQHQQLASDLAENLANRDYQNYLDNVMGLYRTGLSGESGINQMGYGASNQMAQDLADSLLSQANLAYANQQYQNQRKGGLLGGLLSGIENLL